VKELVKWHKLANHWTNILAIKQALDINLLSQATSAKAPLPKVHTVKIYHRQRQQKFALQKSTSESKLSLQGSNIYKHYGKYKLQRKFFE